MECKVTINQFAGTLQKPICKISIKTDDDIIIGKLYYKKIPNFAFTWDIQSPVLKFIAEMQIPRQTVFNIIVDAIKQGQTNYGIRYFRKFTIKEVI